MKSIIFIIGILAFLLTTAVPAFATTYYGAIAYYMNAGYGQTGISYNDSSASSADANAIAACGANCKALANFSSPSCAALAASSNGEWAARVAPTLAEAKYDALNWCISVGFGIDCKIQVAACAYQPSSNKADATAPQAESNPQ